MNLKDIIATWNRIWFTPTSPAPICVYRIIFGILVFLNLVFFSTDFFTWFGPDGLVSIETVQKWEGNPRFSLLFMLPPTNESAVAVYVVALVTSVMVTLGLFTRFSLIVLFICIVSLDHRIPLIMNSGDSFTRFISFLMMFTPCGEMFSIDAKYKRMKGKLPADPWQVRCEPWGQWLLRLELFACYCQTFWAKMEGDSWWNGTAVYYSSRLEEFWKFPIPIIFDHLWTIKLATWGALGIELALWTLIWVKEFRYWVLLAGILLHLGIDWSMNIPLFEWMMMTAYIVWVDPEDIKKVLDWGRARFLKIMGVVPAADLAAAAAAPTSPPASAPAPTVTPVEHEQEKKDEEESN